MFSAQNITTEHRLLKNGEEAFKAMLSAIGAAKKDIRLETYIYKGEGIGEKFRNELISASKRGVKVYVLIDDFGSVELHDSFWNTLREAGGNVRRFNPLGFSRFVFRDHRKILVCDEKVAFLGGFNIAPEYDGDGVNRGWCDHGVEIHGKIAAELAKGFDEMFERADLQHPPFTRFRTTKSRRTIAHLHSTLILSGPGKGGNMLKRWILNDLRRAQNVKIETAYFLPNWRIRRELGKVINRGGIVKLLLAGKTDVQVAKLAAQSLYSRLMRRGIQIFEYQPQILHAKLMIIDNIVYIGSANLDNRSLQINYEAVLRVQDHALAAEARAIFNSDLKNSIQIDPQKWQNSRGLFQKLKEKLSYWLLARFDPLLASYQVRRMIKKEKVFFKT
ncbi:MAG: phosphatidylserine/phosphatidylglycerophosphate/cardiolipin synthase family protein [Verrucomicrobiae bacterium]|nr:phosphatidylserine/phosphatidylglycerophosphate/cardiolipin synthase family protein [Verrucomicrobiae bacterium]